MDGEAGYVAQQAEDARAAIGHTLHAIASDLKESVDVRLWAKEHPWMTVGAAATAGFVAACVFVPTREDQALKRLSKIEKALRPSSPAASSDNNSASAEADQDGASQSSSMWSGIARQIYDAVKPAVLSTLAATVSGKVSQSGSSAQQQQQQPSSSSSGSPPDPSI